MTTMLAAVVLFAVVNYGIKAVGPVLMGSTTLPAAARRVLDALPLALVTAMVVTSVVGARGARLDVTVLLGLVAAATARRLGAGLGSCVVACVVVSSLLRLVL